MSTRGGQLISTTPFRLPRFYPIVDTTLLTNGPISALELSRTLLEAGVTILQYRHKATWLQTQLDEAAAIARFCNDAGVLFVMNDRADYAKLTGAALHIGQDDLPPDAARSIIGDEVIGLSTHNAIQLELGDKQKVEYMSLGPIYETRSKERPDPEVGIEGLRQLRQLTEKPICAIGGITLENAPAVLAAGADSVAVISGLFPAEPSQRWNLKAIRQRVMLWLQLVQATTGKV